MSAESAEITNSPQSGFWESLTSYLSNDPLPGIEYIPIIISSLSLIVSTGVLICYILTLLNRQKDHRRSVIDEFWFRQIYAPLCLNPLFDYITEQLTKLNNHPFTEGDEKGPKEFLELFQNEKRSLINKLMLFGRANPKIFTLVTTKLDEFDDSVTEYCAYNSLGSTVKKKTIGDIESKVYASIGEFIPEITRLHLELDNQKGFLAKIGSKLNSNKS